MQAQTTARLESLILNQLESIEKMQITLAKQDTVITHLVNRIKYLENRNDVMEHMDNTENSQPSTTIQPPSYNNHLMSNKPNISQALKLKIDDYHRTNSNSANSLIGQSKIPLSNKSNNLIIQ